jgi:hypothetical protein
MNRTPKANLPPAVLNFFREQGAAGGRKGGSAGGKKAAARLTPEQRSERARQAVAAREARRKSGFLAFMQDPRRSRVEVLRPTEGPPDVVACNRQHEARLRIIEAMQRLKIPSQWWPDLIQPAMWRGYRHIVVPPPFQPPNIDRLHQSVDDWVRAANVEWRRYTEKRTQAWRTMEESGVDQEIAEAKRKRGPGAKQRNASIDRRDEWAAWRLCGDSWKEIAARYQRQQSAVTKAASEVLRTAGLDTKPKAKLSAPPNQTAG